MFLISLTYLIPSQKILETAIERIRQKNPHLSINDIGKFGIYNGTKTILISFVFVYFTGPFFGTLVGLLAILKYYGSIRLLSLYHKV